MDIKEMRDICLIAKDITEDFTERKCSSDIRTVTFCQAMQSIADVIDECVFDDIKDIADISSNIVQKFSELIK